MNKIPDCSKCERCKSMEYLFDDYYCCEENEPTQIYGLLGVYSPPEVSPVWCPKKVKEKLNYDKIKYYDKNKEKFSYIYETGN